MDRAGAAAIAASLAARDDHRSTPQNLIRGRWHVGATSQIIDRLRGGLAMMDVRWLACAPLIGASRV